MGLFINRHFERKYQAGQEKFHHDLELLIDTAYTYNGWFTRPNVEAALKGIALMLDEQQLVPFAGQVKEPAAMRKVAVIMAGNIPAVGFHDMMCVLLSGHAALIKVSSDDHVLIPFLAGMLIYFEPGFAPRIEFAAAKLEAFDAVIATGSNNSSRYFDYYFGKYPHIIRKNRTSVAVLNGQETKEDLKALGKDIFQYFGLGCRNVTKLFVPEGYVFDAFFDGIYDYGEVINHKKYGNNYDYNRAIYLLDGVPFLDNHFLMIRESKELHPPTATLLYEFYSNQTQLVDKMREQKENLQCIVSNFSVSGIDTIAFGKTQEPGIADFADDVNTVSFLNTL